MNIDALHKASKLASALHDATEWCEMLEQKFDRPSMHGSRMTLECTDAECREKKYSGSLSLPRDLAAEMMRWLESRLREKLTALGVEGVDAPKPPNVKNADAP